MTDSNASTPAPQPEIKGGVIPYLQLDGAVSAARFYQKAFGAEIVSMQPVDDKGRTVNVHLYINGSSVMLIDPFPERGHPSKEPQSFNLTINVDDIDYWWDRAVKAGASVVMPVTDMFWAARYGQLRDQFGVTWALNQPKH